MSRAHARAFEEYARSKGIRGPAHPRNDLYVDKHPVGGSRLGLLGRSTPDVLPREPVTVDYDNARGPTGEELHGSFAGL